ncbi:uncharacterized protein LOC134714432 isoform X2 [Mytilus trossulus]|uniref:uncharacterized protein LOC134714432 isoform X2 n=1 Tax=Mytilus trossulus TaxID=6551 RepID=UPI0030060D7D
MSTTLVIFTLCISFGNASWWHPHPHMNWNYVIGERHINTSIYGNMFVVDLDVDKRIIENLHREGKKVICNFSAGTKECSRKDAGQFPPDGLGAPVKDYPKETWVDIMNIEVRRIMRARIILANSRHCDGVYPSNVDGWVNNQAGLHLTPENQLDYNRYLANAGVPHPQCKFYRSRSPETKRNMLIVKTTS